MTRKYLIIGADELINETVKVQLDALGVDWEYKQIDKAKKDESVPMVIWDEINHFNRVDWEEALKRMRELYTPADKTAIESHYKEKKSKGEKKQQRKEWNSRIFKR